MYLLSLQAMDMKFLLQDIRVFMIVIYFGIMNTHYHPYHKSGLCEYILYNANIVYT